MISVITLTGGRPDSFKLCELWLSRQTYRHGIDWVVVDDCFPRTEFTLRIHQTFVGTFPYWKPGQNTQARNLLAALGKVRHDRILFVEDDDWYSPDYLVNMVRLLERAPLVGQTPSRYYNVATRQYRELPSRGHASLCQTGIRAELIPQLTLCATAGGAIDMSLWRNVAGGLLEPGTDVVGMKGLPGRPGIGVGHRPTCTWSVDPRLDTLRSWIGDDAAQYERFAERAAA